MWVILFTVLIGFFSFPQGKSHITKVVIDAGHGGKDPGALGKKTQEKNITLQIALKLGEMIRVGCKDAIIYFTRDKDEFVELYQRAGLANSLKADLFISIHCNSNPSHSFHGAETYVMGLKRSEANLAVAKQENASILLEADYTQTYNGFDPNSDESYITFSLYQDAYLEQSTEFASVVQDEMKSRAGLNDRGVRQAGFLVLYKTTMPSVLVETGFLSNPDEEKFLNSASGQEFIASAIYKAFRKYKAKMDGSVETAKNEPASPASDSKSPSPASAKKPVPDSGNKTPKNKQQPGPQSRSETEPVRKQEAPPVKELASCTVSYRVQVKTSPKDIGTGSKELEGLKDIMVYKHDGLYKYTTGNESTLAAALKLQEEIQKKGFKDAFVVAFHGDQRITVAEAKKLSGGK